MNNFYQRDGKTCNSTKSQDFITFIDNILNTIPNIKLKENSLLYKAAVNQYNNEILKLPTVERIPVPSWFCGHIDIATGLLYTSDAELIQNNSLLLQNISPSSVTLPISSDQYPIDRCLVETASLPGSLSYANCDIVDIRDVYASQIDWTRSFYPTSIIEEGIQQIEDAVAAQINAVAASYGISEIHYSLTKEECEGLSRLYADYGPSCVDEGAGKYQFNLDGPTDDNEECVARYYRQDIANGRTPEFHDPYECEQGPNIGGAGLSPQSTPGTQKGSMSDVSVSGGLVKFNSSGITSANGYNAKGELRAAIYCNGHRFDDLKESQCNRSTAKTLINIYEDSDYYQNIKQGQTVNFAIVSHDKSVRTNVVSVVWNAESTS